MGLSAQRRLCAFRRAAYVPLLLISFPGQRTRTELVVTRRRLSLGWVQTKLPEQKCVPLLKEQVALQKLMNALKEVGGVEVLIRKRHEWFHFIILVW